MMRMCRVRGGENIIDPFQVGVMLLVPILCLEDNNCYHPAGFLYDTTTDFDLGGFCSQDGEILSDEVLDELRTFDCILLGAVGTPEVPPGVIERGLLLEDALRARPLHQPAAIRRNRPPGGDTPHDFVVIRENTEGPYVGEGGLPSPEDFARSGDTGVRPHTPWRRAVCPLRVQLAAGLLREAPHARPQDQRHACVRQLVERTFNEVRGGVSRHHHRDNHVDAACIYFVQDPHRYDVIVTDNLFGDILTDLGGAVSGGIGLASSAKSNRGLRPARRCSSRCTVRRPTSSAPGRRTRPRRFSAWR